MYNCIQYHIKVEIIIPRKSTESFFKIRNLYNRCAGGGGGGREEVGQCREVGHHPGGVLRGYRGGKVAQRTQICQISRLSNFTLFSNRIFSYFSDIF